MRGEAGMVKVLCPRCGSVGTLVRKRYPNGRVYLFVRHDRKSECYAGAEHYKHVSSVYGGLGFGGPVTVESIVDGLETLVARLERLVEGGAKLDGVRDRVEAVSAVLARLARAGGEAGEGEEDSEQHAPN